MSIPLSRAVLCANCDRISEAKTSRCPVCGSIGIVNLEKLVNKQLAPEPMSVSELERMAK